MSATTVDLTDMDGVGPSREENLIEAGYETFEDIATADPEEIADSVSYLPEDTALELVVQAENIISERDASVEESEPVDGDFDDEDIDEIVEEEFEEDEEDEQVVEENESDEISFDLTFETSGEYDTFYYTLLEQRDELERTNRGGVVAFTEMVDTLRDGTVGEELTFELSAGELNDLHNSVLEQRLDYQSQNLMERMEALRQVENKINDVREEYLF